MSREILLVALPLAAAILLLAAIVLYFREHGRRMRSRGLTPVGRTAPGAPAPGTGAGAAPPAPGANVPAGDVPVLSPWLAAGALMAVGAYIAYDNVIDESLHARTFTTRNPNCAITFAAPLEARPTSVLGIELHTTGPACATLVRQAQLVLDGAPQKDMFPFTDIDGNAVTRRWLAANLPVGAHRLDILTSAQGGSRALSRSLSPASSNPRATPQPTPPSAHSAVCNSSLIEPSPPGAPGQYVALAVRTQCGPEVAAPTLLVNGNLNGTSLPLVQSGKLYVYSWLLKRAAIPERIDVLFSRPQSLYAAQINVRTPVGLGGVKDVLASAGAAVVGLSGLLVAMLQFLRGQKVTS